MKVKRGDKVRIIAGKDKGKEGKILFVDKKSQRVIVENANMITKHQKAGQRQQGGLIKREAALHVSNVMYLYKGEPTRLGYKLEQIEKDGKTVTKKVRVAKSTGEIVD